MTESRQDMDVIVNVRLDNRLVNSCSKKYHHESFHRLYGIRRDKKNRDRHRESGEYLRAKQSEHIRAAQISAPPTNKPAKNLSTGKRISASPRTLIYRDSLTDERSVGNNGVHVLHKSRLALVAFDLSRGSAFLNFNGTERRDVVRFGRIFSAAKRHDPNKGPPALWGRVTLQSPPPRDRASSETRVVSLIIRRCHRSGRTGRERERVRTGVSEVNLAKLPAIALLFLRLFMDGVKL
ncbi:hypothetical protein GWI33_000222 [Rhynchophorus ferrugineus]|uniref:Uncharacterized protein n=1 Tax=Rhynchophorus ferrugineus TaxID=354439 RepID=A0A834IV99_RHYFE|nr:hypothetical protein GWI33_000222 [Rhynchophorus ferrugineus]